MTTLPSWVPDLLPELRTMRLVDEKRASCDSCPMLPKPHEDPEDTRFFRKELHCCTYHPRLPNYLVGRALRRGGVGGDKVLARLQDLDGISLWGVRPDAAYLKRWDKAAEPWFGREASLKCPFYISEGALHCGIWADRNHVCRTWFCKHDSGRSGADRWYALRAALEYVEDCVATWCMEQATSPPVGVSGHVAWFLEAARLADSLPVDAVRERMTKLEGFRGVLQACEEDFERPTPEVLVPSPQWSEQDGNHAVLYGTAGYDPTVVPRNVFVFLSLLDGVRTWKAALEASPPEVRAWLDDAGVERLFRQGVVDSAETIPPHLRGQAKHPEMR